MKLITLKWINLFVRDLLLIFIVLYLQYATYFNSKVVWLITGILACWITWQVSDLTKLINLDNGIRFNNKSSSCYPNISNNLRSNKGPGIRRSNRGNN